jgi:hypothetical protein
MKHQVQYGTDCGMVSKQAAKKVRVLVADLTRAVQILENDIATKKTRMLKTRHQNLIDTIACLEDRLRSIEHLRASKYRRLTDEIPATLAQLPDASPCPIR